MPIPLLILSDGVTSKTGLGRIAREIATKIAREMPEFRVATIGEGGAGTIHLPFPSYHGRPVKDWVVPELPLAWHDFAGQERGILLVIWDASRMEWLIDPPDDLIFADWLKNRPFDLWTYTPIDAEGPHGKLTKGLQEILAGFDRVLNYTEFSSNVTGYPDHLPHGIDTEIFHPKENAKEKFRTYGYRTLEDSDLLVGVVATNQTRKDWPLAIQTVSILRDRGHSVKLWGHTDVLSRYWNIEALLHDYGWDADHAVITVQQFPDIFLADLYSACDVTLGIGLGEGFGYPLAESLACGTPVIHGRYAGGAEFVPKWMLVDAVGWHYETPYCWKRPVYDPEDWADRIEKLNGTPAKLPLQLDWKNNWPKWREWLLKGIK